MGLTKGQRIAAVKAKVSSIMDFPIKGINFRDIFPVMRCPEIFDDCIALMAEEILENEKPDAIVGLDARGFIFGALLANKLQLPFVPIRKAGKLPGKCESISYSLEYGESTFEIQTDSLKKGSKVVIVDDLLATGGTMSAACELVKLMGAVVQLCIVAIELPELQGRKKMSDPLFSLISFEGH